MGKIIGRIAVLSIAAALTLFAATTFAAQASPASSKVLVDGNEKSFEAYNIDGSNYFKLRDLAFVLNGTWKQFEVGYDASTKAVTITTGTAYTPAGGEMEVSASQAQEAVPTQSRIFVDGDEIQLTVYNIGGNNYFKLRDIAEAIDCGVEYDQATGTIGIDTAKNYMAPQPAPQPQQPAAGQALSETITETPEIGGNTAKLVYIPTGWNRNAEVITANGNVCSDEKAAELIKRASGKVVAAINGGFFASYYNPSKPIAFPDNYPGIYGAIMKNGRVINGGGATNAVGFTGDGKLLIDSVEVKTDFVVKKPDGDKHFTIWGVNKYYEDNGSVNMFTPEFTLHFSTNADSKVISVKEGKVTAIADGGNFIVPGGTTIVVFNSGATENAMQWETFPAVGDSAEFVTTLTPRKTADAERWGQVQTIAAGGRMLLQNGNIVTNDESYNKTFDADPKQASFTKAQRSFAAALSDGRILFGTANASFDEIAEYLKSKNVVDAVSLDGGASSMLYVEGKGFLTSAGRNLASIVVIIDK